MQRTPSAQEVDRSYLAEVLIGEYQCHGLSCVGGPFQHAHAPRRRIRPEYPIVGAETPVQIGRQRIQNRPVTGTWRDGYVELSFTGEWPKEIPQGKPGEVTATLAGWIDGDAGKGRGKIEAHADGAWTATKKP